MKLLFAHIIAVYHISALVTAMKYKDPMDKMDMMDNMDTKDKMDKMEKMDKASKKDKSIMPTSEPRCATQGQFLTSPNGDQCSYMICVYGGDSYDAADHKPLMYTRRMPCAPGTYVPTNYKDTKPARNPCVGMDTAACPAPEKPTEIPDEDEQEPDAPDYDAEPVVQPSNVPLNSYRPPRPQSGPRRMEMDKLYEQMKAMMEQMMAIRRRLQAFEGPSYSPEPRTFEASPGLFKPEPTNGGTITQEKEAEEPEHLTTPVRLQQSGYALAGGNNGVVRSLPRDEVNNIWHGVQKALSNPGDEAKEAVVQADGYSGFNKQEERPSLSPQLGYRPTLTMPNKANPGSPRVVYLLPVRMPVKRNN